MKNLTAASLFQITIVGTTATSFTGLALIDASVKSLLVLILAAIICLALFKTSAATRHLVWAATLLGILLMPPCALLLPQWLVLPDWLSLENRIGLVSQPTRIVETENSGLVKTSSTVFNPFAATLPSAGDPNSLEYVPLVREFDSREPAIQSTPQAARAESWTGPIPIRVHAWQVIGVWAVGCVLWLLPMLIAFFRLRIIERNYMSDEPLAPKLDACIKNVASDLGIRFPRVIIGPAGAMPMVWSFFASRLLLPADAEKWPEARLNAVLLHEMVHLRRYDPFICSLGLVARAVNWFNPLAWYAVYRLRMECEQACDDQVLQKGIDASEYASHLLALSTFIRIESRTLPLAMTMACKPSVEARNISILDENRDRRNVTFVRVFGMFAVVSIVVAVLASTAMRVVSDEGMQDHDLTTFTISGSGENIIEGEAEKPMEAEQPASVVDAKDRKYFELTLEECIAYALKNTGLVRLAPNLPSSEIPLANTIHATTTTTLHEVTGQDGNRIESRDAARLPPSNHVIRALEEIDDRLNSFGAKSKGTSIESVSSQWKRSSLVNRVPVVLSRMNEDISIELYEERVCNLIRDVEFAYWDLYNAHFAVDTVRSAMDSAALSHKVAFDRLTAGVSPNAEAQARAVYLERKSKLDAAIGGDSKSEAPGLFSRERNLRLLIGDKEDGGKMIRPSDTPATSFIEFDWETARNETLSRNVDLRQQKNSVQKRELELISARNQASPDVNLQLMYRWLGDGRHAPPSGVDTPIAGQPRAFKELFGGTYQDGGVRMEFNPYGFGSRRQKSDVRQNQLALASELKVLEAKEIATVNKLSALRQRLTSHYNQQSELGQVLSAAKALVDVSKARFDSEVSNDTMNNLLRAQEMQCSTYQKYMRALTETNKSLVELHAIKGSLLAYNNLTLQPELPMGSRNR